MTPAQLEKELNEALDNFREEMIFLIDTHDEKYLTNYDLENIARQVFYTLDNFIKIIVKYTKTSR